jgi:hypothetical protein
MRRALPIIVTFILILGCSTIDQQKAQPARTDQLHFKNLKVLPPDISRDDLIATMRGFTRGLGTRCDFCHAAGPPSSDGKEQLDFASDAKEEKNTARTMIRMTKTINADFISHVEPTLDNPVTCGTCHRGHTEPEPFNPPAPAAAPH